MIIESRQAASGGIDVRRIDIQDVGQATPVFGIAWNRRRCFQLQGLVLAPSKRRVSKGETQSDKL